MSNPWQYGKDFEDEFANSIRLLVEWCDHLGLNHRHLDYHKIIDTNAINRVDGCRKKGCGAQNVICAACGAPREILPAPRATADYTWDLSNIVYEVECKSSKRGSAFPMKENIKDHQMERCRKIESSTAKNYIWIY